MKSEYTASNCANHESIRSDHLHDSNIPLPAELDVNSFDFQIYWQPACGDAYSGEAFLGETMSLIHVNTGFRYKDNGREAAATTLAHELAHNFGAGHASCISDKNRGAVAWCDSDVTTASHECNLTSSSWTEYCSPHSIMGTPHTTRPLLNRQVYMDGKLTFDWANSVNHPNLVSTIDWDAATNKYTGCDTGCTFLLQRSDAPTLDNSASAVILLQTTHSSSNGNRYFVMEHRSTGYDTPILLVHWTDIRPTEKATGLVRQP